MAILFINENCLFFSRPKMEYMFSLKGKIFSHNFTKLSNE